MRHTVSTTLLAIACLACAIPAQGPGPDQPDMTATKPIKGNYPPLPPGFGHYQILALGSAPRPFQFPGIAGGLLVDLQSLIIVPDRSGFGSELDWFLRAVGQQGLVWQTLREEEKSYFALSELLAVSGSGRSKQIDDVAVCEARAIEHMKAAIGDGIAPGWAGTRGLLRPAPLYRPDVSGVAYYEFPVDVGGFIVIATGEHDYPVSHWSDEGRPLATTLDELARKNNAKVARMFKLDTLSYVAEDDTGALVAQIGSMPSRLVPDPKRLGGFQIVDWSSWPALKDGFIGTYRPLIENLRMDAADLWHVERNTTDGKWGRWSYAWAGSHADQRPYNQFDFNGCWVGCGPVAWAMLFGWGDYRASVGDPRWNHRWGLYRQNGGYGADAAAPSANDVGIDNAIREIRGHVLTFCSSGSGATYPGTMHQADRYLSGRTWASLTTHFNPIGIHEDRLRDLAIASIYGGTPAIIGTGWLSHYPLAYGYAQRTKTEPFLWWERTVYSRWFYVNNGWGGASNGWVAAGSWFCGRLFAN